MMVTLTCNVTDLPIFIVDVLLEGDIVFDILMDIFMDILALTIIMADDDFMGGIKRGDLPRKKEKEFINFNHLIKSS